MRLVQANSVSCKSRTFVTCRA